MDKSAGKSIVDENKYNNKTYMNNAATLIDQSINLNENYFQPLRRKPKKTSSITSKTTTSLTI